MMMMIKTLDIMAITCIKLMVYSLALGNGREFRTGK